MAESKHSSLENMDSNISISVLKSILNGMNAFLYVTDPETDEILFMNDKIKRHFNIKGSGIGEKCWKILRDDMSGRCDFCPMYKLEKDPDKAVMWEIYNPFTRRIYQCTDSLITWTGDKLVHLQHNVDITELKNAEHNIRERLEQQELMSAVSQSFISSDSVDNLIENALKMVGEFMKVSSIVLLVYNPKEHVLKLRNAWNSMICPHRSEKMPFYEGTLEYDAFITNNMEDVVFDDISKAENFTCLVECGVKAVIQVPLKVDGAFWGILSFNECSGPRNWTSSDIQLVGLIGSVITGVIGQSRMKERYLRMADIVNGSPQYIAYINAEGIVEFINQGSLNNLGYTMDEILGNSISLSLDEENYRRTMDFLIPAVLQEGRLEFELPIIRKDGETRILSVSAFKTEFGDLGVSVIADDVTDRKRLEKRLLVAMEQAEASNLAKSEFLSRMSHEMRTPMNAIIGMTHIAKSSNDSSKKEYCLEKIGEASDHLLGVINDILDMSKIEAGKLELSETEFLFEKMLIRVIDVVKYRIDEQKQNLVLDIDPTVSNFVLADEQRFAQIITNLLSNAVKFTPEGGTIMLSVKNLGFEGNTILKRVSVTDTGIGISEEQQKNLFQSFEQADGSISRKFGGTGLGLAISKKIVELMGGSIKIESELGKGASFIVEIPVKKGKKDRMSLFNPDINWKALRILAVDDNPYNLHYFKGFSESIGMFCETALGGEEALGKLAQIHDNPFDIIFVDFKMPGMNGIELTKKIISYDVSSVVIMMASMNLWEDIDKEAKQAGVHGFLAKPLFSAQIINSINSSLRSEKAPDKASPEEDAIRNIFAGLRILLAEDIEINQDIVVSLLEPTGVFIDTAKNGVEAIRRFKENPFAYNAVLMDIHMPEMDGYEATRFIRQLDQGNAQIIPIIAMTANVFKEDIEKCLSAGMNDHVGKPIEFDDLIGKLKIYLLPN